MKKYVKSRASILLLAGVLFLCTGTASATDQIAIDPVPENLMTGSVVEITGTTTFSVGTNLHYEFSREVAETGGIRYGDYSGAEGIIPVEKGSAGQAWKVPVLTEGYAPGNYTFRIGREGSDDRVSVQVRLATGEGTPVTTPKAAERNACAEFQSPVYVSPGGTFSVRTSPDLNTRCNILAKGTPLTMTAETSPGNLVGIWITSASPKTRYTHFQKISADGSGNAEYVLPDTTGMKSGQYFIYMIYGGKALEVMPDENNASAYLTVDVLETRLKAYEKQNPYQKFMILLEEPWIRVPVIPDAISGTPVEIEGTTNLNAGTPLSIEIFPPDIDRLEQPAFAVSEISVAEGTDGSGSWHAVIDTSGRPPGEYIVKVRNGSVEAAQILVLYDSLYDPGVSPRESLVAKTYDVDPETKTVITGTPAREAGFPADPGMLAMTCSAGLIGLGATAGRLRKK